MRHRKTETKPECPLSDIAGNLIRIKQRVSKQSAAVGFTGLFLCIASACTTDQKQGKHMVWVPAETGSHLGGRWVEVDESAKPAPGASNVQRANAEELQRQAQNMGSSGSGN